MQQRDELIQVNDTGSSVSVCLLPGCGEHLIRTMLARECSVAMQSEDAHQALLEAMQNKFISESPTSSLVPAPFPYTQIRQPRTCLRETQLCTERIKLTNRCCVTEGMS